MSSKPMPGCRVLVVEDNYLIGIDLADMLELAGAKVAGPVVSVADALNAIDSLPDAATLDVQLGEETSFPIADELARRRGAVRVRDRRSGPDTRGIPLPTALS
jgi:CheY-like chemotaxis protein